MSSKLDRVVVLTGATGFVGGNLIKKLIENQFHVIGLYREKNNEIPQSLGPYCFWKKPSELESFISGRRIHAVVHLATDYGKSNKLGQMQHVNVGLPLQIFTCCAANGCKLFITTDTFFGKDNFKYQHMQAYIYSKKDLATWLRFFCELNSHVSVVNMRLEHVYGYGDRQGKFIPDLIRDLRANKEVILMTSGEQRRDFIFVDDVVAAYMKILSGNNCVGFSEYEIGTGRMTSIKDLANLLLKYTKSRSKLVFGALQYREGEIMASSSSSRMQEDYDWHAETSLDDGLRKYCNTANDCCS